MEEHSMSHLKLLQRRIQHVKNRKCYIDIFKIIQRDNIEHTINSNGVFFNLTPLTQTIIDDIDNTLKRYEEKQTTKTSKHEHNNKHDTITSTC